MTNIFWQVKINYHSWPQKIKVNSLAFIILGEEAYEIDYIFGKMFDKKNKDIKYAVKWDGYSLEEMSWEPRESFVDETEKCVR